MSKPSGPIDINGHTRLSYRVLENQGSAQVIEMEPQPIKSSKALITATVLFVLDAFVMNQGAISIILILLIVFWWVPKSAFKKYKGQSPKVELTKALIYGSVAIVVFSSNIINNKIAKGRANNLIQVIENYHQTTGQYPQTLTELVPAYLQNVPKAKYTLIFNKFTYINYQGSVSLFYVSLPPYGRPTYVFNRKEWKYID
jgi:hypothetical protein